MQRITSSLLSTCLLLTSVNLSAIEVTAMLDWSDMRELGTTVSGKVTQVNARPGMLVNKGETLVELDQRFFKMNLERTRAARQSTRLLMEEAQREQDRAIELYDRTVISDFERQQADILLASARADYASAKAEFEKARLEKEYSQITAPFDAVVIDVETAVGEVVVNENQSQVLIELARADAMLSRAEVTSEQVSGITIDQEIEVAFRGKWVEGKVYSISPVASAQEPKYQLTVSFEIKPDVRARAGEASAIKLSD